MLADKNAVDGNWSGWSKYDKCSATCGWGVTQRRRTCTNPPPKGSGKKCGGSSFERKLCRRKKCSGYGNTVLFKLLYSSLNVHYSLF